MKILQYNAVFADVETALEKRYGAILDHLFSSVASGGKLAYHCAEMAIRSLRLIIRYPIPLPLQVIDRNSLHQFAFSPAFALSAVIGVTTEIVA